MFPAKGTSISSQFMKSVIFNDKENFDRSLNRLNKHRTPEKKRFWKIKLFHDYIFHKVTSILKDNTNNLELIKTIIYTGEYNSRAINNVKRNCGTKIKEMNELIGKENLLLSKIFTIEEHDELKKEIIEHVDTLKQTFEETKGKQLKVIHQQSKNLDGQQKFFAYVREQLPFTELRTTPLVTRQGYIQQKGVDAMISIDLILFAQSNAFDVAILLSGDLDLKEAINHIRKKYGKLVFVVAYYSPVPEEKQYNTISEDLIKECDYFLNLYYFKEEDIAKISVPKEQRPLEPYFSE